jgi:hypothetical protein
MKKIVMLVFVVLGTMALNAQVRDRDRLQDPDQNQDRLMLVDGDVLQIRDRDQIRLQEPLTLDDGTVVYPNGTYLTRDRDRLRLRDGECLDNDGVKYRNEYQYRYKVLQSDKGLTDQQVMERNQNRFQLMRIDGEVYQIRTQSQNRLQERLELANGIMVDPNGSYMNQNREQTRLKEGECLNLNGEKFTNMYNHRKMMMNRQMKSINNMKSKKSMNKTTLKKKGGR